MKLKISGSEVVLKKYITQEDDLKKEEILWQGVSAKTNSEATVAMMKNTSKAILFQVVASIETIDGKEATEEIVKKLPKNDYKQIMNEAAILWQEEEKKKD